VLLRAWMGRGPLAAALWPASLLYRALVGLRALGYRCGLLRTHRMPVPVLVVGNLIAGGAGKTPVVLALVAWLKQQGWRVGVVSRGHGRQGEAALEVLPSHGAAEAGDEPLLLQRRAQVPVVVGRDRAQAARLLLLRHPSVDMIVSDDGLQHTALQRDIQVMVFDERGAGNGWLLPAGPLREPLPRHCPPRTLVLYNAPRPSTPLPGHLGQRRLQGLVAWPDWQAGRAASPDALRVLAERSQHETVWAAAGIARPARFFELLQQAGVRLTPLPLPDHHDFSAGAPWPATARCVVVTEKDAVKLTASTLGGAEVWVAPLDFSLDPAFYDALAALLRALPFHPSSSSSPAEHHGHPTA
jgi:tetraacyldisaccharide 4'-kinase